MRTNGVTEQSVTSVFDKPIASAVLFVAPSPRQVTDKSDIIINNRLIPQGRTNDPITALPQRIEQCLQPFLGYDGLLAGFHGHLNCTKISKMLMVTTFCRTLPDCLRDTLHTRRPPCPLSRRQDRGWRSLWPV